MSWFFAGLSLSAAIVSLAVASVVFLRDQRSALNRVFALLCLSVAYWSFVQFQARQAPDALTAALWMKAVAPWPIVEALLLHFVLLFTERTKLLRWKPIYAVIYLPAVAIAAIDLTTRWITGAPIKAFWGWTSVYLGTPMNAIADAYILTWTLASLALCFDCYLRERDPVSKRRTLWVLVGISIPIVVGIATDMFLPRFMVVPEFAPAAAALGTACCGGFAMWRYQLFPITPATAADRIVATMSDCLLLTDLGGTILTVNPAGTELIGLRAKELVGSSISEILSGVLDASSDTEAAFDPAPPEDGRAEVMLMTKNGDVVPVVLVWSVMKEDDRGPAGIVWLAHDISERKRVERIKSDLVAMVSREIRNPLGIVSEKARIAERLLKAGLPDERCLNAVRQVQAQAGSMGDLVDDLLDAYRMEIGDLTPLLQDVEVVVLLQRQAERLDVERTHRLSFEVPKEVPLVRCDPRRMSVAFASLLKNAVKFSPGGGAIAVSVRHDRNHVQVSVADQGVGISDASRERIFERFEQGDPSARREFPGVGMGLYLVREIMLAHGGSVSVESTAGQGSIFTLHIPVRPPEERSVSQETQDPRLSPQS